MLLLIDNYDSFTYNLAQYLGELVAFVSGLELRWSPSRVDFKLLASK